MKGIQNNTDGNEQMQDFEVSKKQIEILARRLLPEIKGFFANDGIRREFDEWHKKRQEEDQKK